MKYNESMEFIPKEFDSEKPPAQVESINVEIIRARIIELSTALYRLSFSFERGRIELEEVALKIENLLTLENSELLFNSLLNSETSLSAIDGLDSVFKSLLKIQNEILARGDDGLFLDKVYETYLDFIARFDRNHILSLSDSINTPLDSEDFGKVFLTRAGLNTSIGKMLRRLVIFGAPDQQEVAISATQLSMAKFVKYWYLTDLVYIAMDEVERVKFVERLLSDIDNRNNVGYLYGIQRIVQLCLSPDLEVKNVGYGLFDSALSRFGIDPSKFFAIWENSGGYGEKREKYILRNIEAMDSLEAELPGSVSLLYHEFGIVNFSRYPRPMLTQQVKEREMTENPYGVILYPYTDYNGSFEMDDGILQQLRDQLPQRYCIRILECGGRVGVAKALLKLDKKYGAEQKIEFMILGGHGTENMIQFGAGDSSSSSLSAEDLMGPGSARASGFFSKNPTVMLFSCSTGVEGGIAHKLSERIGATVIAPDIPTAPSEIFVKDDGNRLEFSVEYSRDDGSRGNPAQRYTRGIKFGA